MQATAAGGSGDGGVCGGDSRTKILKWTLVRCSLLFVGLTKYGPGSLSTYLRDPKNTALA